MDRKGRKKREVKWRRNGIETKTRRCCDSKHRSRGRGSKNTTILMIIKNHCTDIAYGDGLHTLILTDFIFLFLIYHALQKKIHTHTILLLLFLLRHTENTKYTITAACQQQRITETCRQKRNFPAVNSISHDQSPRPPFWRRTQLAE